MKNLGAVNDPKDLVTKEHAASSVSYTATLPSSGWAGSAAPYSQTITINGLLATDEPIMDVVMSGTYSTDSARSEEWGYLYRAVAAANSLTVYASEKPTIDLPIRLKVIRT